MPLFNSLLRRAIEMMRNRPLAHKVGALLAALVIPLLILLTLQWRDHQRLVDFSAEELLGLDVIQHVSAVASQVEEVRGAIAASSHTVDVSAGGAKVEAATQIQTLKQSVDVLRAAVTSGPLSDLSRDLDLALEPVVRLIQDPQAQDRRLYDAAHSRAAASLKEFNLRVAERSGLLLDPDAQSYFLMDLVVERRKLES